VIDLFLNIAPDLVIGNRFVQTWHYPALVFVLISWENIKTYIGENYELS